NATTTSKQPEQTLASDLFNQLKKEIEETQRPNTIKLINNGNLDNKIKNTKLSSNQTEELQKLQLSKLDKLCLKQYSYYIDLMNNTEDITILNNLHNTIFNDDKVLTAMQISNILKNINDKIFRINQKKEYNLIKNEIIKEKDSIRLEKLDKIQSETEDELYDINSELIDIIQDLNELGNNLDLANDILKLNQTLLTGDRNIRGNTNAQISWIVDEYKKTLNKDDKRKFTLKAKIDYVKELIRDSHIKSKDRKTLLDVLYYIWVLGKDDKFLLTRYMTKKIEEAKSLKNNIDKYIW
ncbi:14249_t:CDS:2, partial [Racocetra fulgida]